MIALKDLHDAVLEEIRMVWETGDLHFRFGVMIGDVRVVSVIARAVVSLDCPRWFPWGRSSTVNEASLTRMGSAGPVMIVLEMQSGDQIRAIASEVVVTEGTSGSPGMAEECCS